MADDRDAERDGNPVPVVVLDESAGPQRLLRDRWALTRAEAFRIAAALAILMVLFALAGFLVWRRLRIRTLLQPIPHRTRTAPPRATPPLRRTP